MHINRIVEAVYFKPWYLTAAMHTVISGIVENKLQGKIQENLDLDAMERDLPKMEIREGIAVIPVKGTIIKGAGLMEKICGACSPDEIGHNLELALANPAVRGIMLDINSPGGYVTGIPELAQQIADARAQKPVAVFTDELMASAAYFIAAGATMIWATRSAMVGSIGTYAYILDRSRQFDDAGLRPEVFISEGSIFKAAGLPGVALTEEQKQEIQRSVNVANANFKGFVQENRADVNPDALRGQVMYGDEAREAGLVDSVGSFQDAMEDLILACDRDKSRK